MAHAWVFVSHPDYMDYALGMKLYCKTLSNVDFFKGTTRVFFQYPLPVIIIIQNNMLFLVVDHQNHIYMQSA